jgi:hypothetical protein
VLFLFLGTGSEDLDWAFQLGFDASLLFGLLGVDATTVLQSVAKTGRLVVVDEARECCSAASQIAAVVAEQGFDSLRAPIQRVTTPNVAMPYAPNAEARVIPGEARISAAVLALVAEASAADPAGIAAGQPGQG